MPPDYSLAKDALRFVQCVVVGAVGWLLFAKLLPDTRIMADVLIIWIIGFVAIGGFFLGRAILVIFLRLGGRNI
jgi:hypothetical protein